MIRSTLTLTGTVVLLSSASTWAHAAEEDKWSLLGGVAAGTTLHQADDGAYTPGGVAEIGAYRAVIPQLSIGANVQVGGMADPDSVVADSGNEAFGLGLLAGAVRAYPLASGRRGNPGGLYLEAAAGAGLVASDVYPAIAPSIGYLFEVATIHVGPSVEYLQMIQTDGDNVEPLDLKALLIGVEVSFSSGRTVDEVRNEEPYGGGAQVWPADGQQGQDETLDDGASDMDADGIPDAVDNCPERAEVINGFNDLDGCPDVAEVVFIDRNLVIDEAVLFDTGSAQLRPQGRDALAGMAEFLKTFKEDWSGLIVQGHADSRGDALYNLELSQARANAVKAYLIQQGISAEKIETTGYGEWRPQAPKADEVGKYQKNRRVEFVIAE